MSKAPLGDFVLSWPALQLLKKNNPHAFVYVLLTDYVAPLAKECPWIDQVIILQPGLLGFIKTLLQIRQHKIDYSISFFISFKTALLFFLSRVKHRVAPKTKLWCVLYNNRFKQKRSQCLYPEYSYNVQLMQHFLCIPIDPDYKMQLDYIKIDKDFQSNFFADTKSINLKKKIAVHIGTGKTKGSSTQLHTSQWVKLIKLLNSLPVHIILTAGPQELYEVKNLQQTLLKQQIDCSVYYSDRGLVYFARDLMNFDLFIAGSTGTLHLFSSMNKPTIGFFTAHTTGSIPRWRPLNDIDKQLNIIPPTGYSKDEEFNQLDIHNIFDQQIKPFIYQQLLNN